MAGRNWRKTTRDEREDLRGSADAITIGWFFFAAIGIGFLAGHWIEDRFHISPWGTMAGVMLGIGAGFYNLVQVARRLDDSGKKR
ncbi:MAG TPA: AtpZ/AtpI family protein [Armatimonadota bacterium]|jgi:F0F1-type ATP synthase assembly protein I